MGSKILFLITFFFLLFPLFSQGEFKDSILSVSLWIAQAEAQTDSSNSYMIAPIPLKEKPHKKPIDAFILNLKNEGKLIGWDDGTVNILRTEADHCFDCTVSQLNKISNDPMRGICNVVTKSEICKSVKKEDLIDCKNWRKKGVITDPFSLLAGCSKGLFTSAKTFLKFMWEVLKWIGRTALSPIDTSLRGIEYTNSARLYLVNEYDKAYDQANSIFPGKSVKASGAVAQKVAEMFVNGVVSSLKQDEEFGCYNDKARTREICELVGELTFPPATALAFLKIGRRVHKEDILNVGEMRNSHSPPRGTRRLNPSNIEDIYRWGVPIKIKGTEGLPVNAKVTQMNPDNSFVVSWSEKGEKWEGIVKTDRKDGAMSISWADKEGVRYKIQDAFVDDLSMVKALEDARGRINKIKRTLAKKGVNAPMTAKQEALMLRLTEGVGARMTAHEKYYLRRSHNLKEPYTEELHLPIHDAKNFGTDNIIDLNSRTKLGQTFKKVQVHHKDGDIFHISWSGFRGKRHKARVEVGGRETIIISDSDKRDLLKSVGFKEGDINRILKSKIIDKNKPSHGEGRVFYGGNRDIPAGKNIPATNDDVIIKTPE